MVFYQIPVLFHISRLLNVALSHDICHLDKMYLLIKGLKSVLGSFKFELPRLSEAFAFTSAVSSQLAFYVNLHRAVIGPSATLTGRWRPDIDLRRMLTGITSYANMAEEPEEQTFLSFR